MSPPSPHRAPRPEAAPPPPPPSPRGPQNFPGGCRRGLPAAPRERGQPYSGRAAFSPRSPPRCPPLSPQAGASLRAARRELVPGRGGGELGYLPRWGRGGCRGAQAVLEAAASPPRSSPPMQLAWLLSGGRLGGTRRLQAPRGERRVPAPHRSAPRPRHGGRGAGGSPEAASREGREEGGGGALPI